MPPPNFFFSSVFIQICTLHTQPKHKCTQTHGQTSSTTHPTAHVHLCHFSHTIKAGHLMLAPHGGRAHQRFYFFISSQRRRRCFCWNANELAHLAVENEEAQQMHTAKLSSFINASMLFQFPPVKRFYRNNYWGK